MTDHEIAELYKTGEVNLRQLARMLKTSEPRIAERLQTAGIELRKPGQRIPQKHESDEQIVSYYDAGWSLRQIAAHLHWSQNYVRHRLQANGIKMRSRGGSDRRPSILPHSEMEKTIFLYKEMEMSMQQIAETMNVSRGTVARRLHNAGVEVRPRGGAGQAFYTNRAKTQ